MPNANRLHRPKTSASLRWVQAEKKQQAKDFEKIKQSIILFFIHYF